MADVPTWVEVANGVGGAVGAVSAAVVGGVALTLQRRSNGDERDRQAALLEHELARAEQAVERARLWERRSTVYGTLLDALQPGGQLRDQARARAVHDAAWPLRGTVHLYGSPGVTEAFDRLLAASRQVGEGALDDSSLSGFSRADYDVRREVRLSIGGDLAVELDLQLPEAPPVAVPAPAAGPEGRGPGQPAPHSHRREEVAVEELVAAHVAAASAFDPVAPAPRTPAHHVADPTPGRHRRVS